MFRRKPLAGVLVFLCTCFFGASLFAQTRADSTWSMFHHDLYNTGLSPLTGDMDTCFLYWSYTTGDIICSSPALGDIDGDGKLEVVVGSYCEVYTLNGEEIGVEEKVTITPEVFFISGIKPNPFTTSTTIYFPSTGHSAEGEAQSKQKVTLEIYDISGRLVKSVPLSTNHLSLGTDFPPGIYFLKVDGKPVGKVVKVR